VVETPAIIERLQWHQKTLDMVRRAVTPEDNRSSLFEIELWRQMKLYASVMKIK
jgi:hypothetical protein